MGLIILKYRNFWVKKQGMNEILAIIYYSFVNYEFEDSKCHAESDTYWCFLNLINTVN